MANPRLEGLTVPPPSDDKRWRIVQTTMRRHGFSADALIETLHSTQAAFGFLDNASLLYVAKNLNIPLSFVYGVATFYNLFTMRPPGDHTCIVCLGTACYIQGGQDIMNALEAAAGVRRGETTPDKKVSLLVARCVGACGLAPACVLDGEVAGKLKPADVVARVKEWSADEP